MRLLVVTAALAAAIASPALAQSAHRAPVQQYQSQYDQPFGRFEGRPQSAPSGNDVYEAGQYLGRDPDPNVRLELRRDFEKGGS
jgi:hypothetical protein